MAVKSNLFHSVVYVISRFVGWFLLLKYTFRTDKVPKIDGPFLMLCNHTTESDLIMAMRASRKHIYFVCGEHLLRGKFGPFLKKFFDPVSIPKGGGSLSAIKDMHERIKAGFNICLFPEGSRSFNGETKPLTDATGKMIKLFKCSLVTYRIRGGYFIAPRWGYHFRKGHAEGKVMGVYTSEELKNMSPSEITTLINNDIYENAYETQRSEMHEYRGEKLAEGLGNYLIICPECGAYDTIKTEGDRFFCSQCNAEGTYDNYGFLKSEDFRFDSVCDWGKWIEERFDSDMDKAEDGILFTENDIRLYEIFEDHTDKDIMTGTLEIYKDRLLMEGKEFKFSDIKALDMLYFGKTLLFTTEEGYFGMTGEHFHAWKCERLYERTKKEYA